MIHQMFSIFDNKAGSYLPPFTMPNIEMAKRTFSECANDKNHMFCKHPEDFTLYNIGDFNDETAVLVHYEASGVLGMASQYKERE